MVKNPYIVLGVSLTATDTEIRNAFRTLAKQYHPDRNPDDAVSEEKFKEISRAFDILGDSERRRKYDNGEIDAEGKPADPFARQWGGREGAAARAKARSSAAFGQARRRPGGPSAGASFDDLSDIFVDLFGGARPREAARGRDVRYRLEVDFLDAALGATKRVTMPDERILDLTIPIGLEDGQTLRLREEGEPGEAGGPPGDVYVETQILPHPVFSRDGQDIHIDVPISLREAVLGAKITVQTIEGEVAVTIPAGSNTGTTLRLRGRGLQGQGDQYVKLKIMLPDEVDAELEKFARLWKAGAMHAPRKKS